MTLPWLLVRIISSWTFPSSSSSSSPDSAADSWRTFSKDFFLASIASLEGFFRGAGPGPEARLAGAEDSCGRKGGMLGRVLLISGSGLVESVFEIPSPPKLRSRSD
ncbi:hypothetical protein KC322_g78 [Hortaea werneckii]|nr:hypothetical protein KC322_g78 [Hortaea werneckii]